ncbi:putative hydrolase or acyltransferase of alpha/beta superfamily [Rhizobium leguminosarum bv. trifolii WSM597]|uniref:Putative hydrolase or acyltransferase of alpha/beta superfamily n=1 Tax=Rhizobium leguminosarum bv. trifolii WSM597 TaxID=754764 RepID=I9NJU3_RHILT|nr:alpha/beta hydrolase [Rhizobium leguminosarum]EJB07007.1 putative hydrolase or acyltransferase of alpha/beta superfamily [Rhizobium leguminosarum bv. trifolii WSM597]
MTLKQFVKPLFTAVALAILATPGIAMAQVKKVVLVHGMNMDGGAWSSVYKRLVSDGYQVVVAQMPMTSIGDDIAAVRRAITMANGPVVLVGHSYGGMVISQAGTSPDVKALVYVAAFQPEIGESLAKLNSSTPAKLPADSLQVLKDGFYTVKPEAWIADVANGVSKDEAQYTANFQTPVNSAIFGYTAEAAAWHDKPVWSAIATEDRTISPELQRMMSKRSKAETLEIQGGHLLQISNSREVTALIEKAANAVD